MNFKKSQTATEYIVIVAVVIVVALVVVQVMGGFPGIGSGSSKKISDYKLSSGVIGVEQYFIGPNNSTFKLKNNNYDVITILSLRVNRQESLTCNLSNTNPSLPLPMAIGESKIFTCSAVNLSSYPISDKQTPLIGILYLDQNGVQRFSGNVESYDALNNTFYLDGLNSSNSSNVSNSSSLNLTDGLIAYYSLDGNYSDLSGNENNGNCSGVSCPTLNSLGVIGNAYGFDGVNDNINISDSTSLRIQNNMSIGFWIKKSGNGFNVLAKGAAVGNYNSYEIRALDNYKLNFYLDNYISNKWVSWDSTNVVLTQNVWSYVLFTWSYNGSSSDATLYVDGISMPLTQTANQGYNSGFTIGYSSDPFYIGRDWGGGSVFNGSLDEIRIYNRSLNVSEVLDLYNLGSNTSSKVLAMNFDSDALNYLNLPYNYRTSGEQGISILDASIYNNSGTSSGLAKQYWWNANTVGASIINGSLQFDGVNDYLQTSITGVPSGAAPRTISAWFNAKSIPVGNLYGSIFSYGTTGCTGGDFNKNFDALVGNTNKLYFHINGNIASGAAGIVQTSISTNTWYNIVYIYDGLNISAYVNGVLKFSEARTLSTSALGLYLGKASITCAPGYFNGSVDDVIVWSRVLNSTEVSTIYTEGLAGRTVSMDSSSSASRTIPASGRVSYWNFDNDSRDYFGSNNGYDGFNATGGSVSYSGGYTIHTFTSSGTLNVSGYGNVSVLVVAGGGGGANTGAGGGGGGYIYNASFAVIPQLYSVTVGPGGSGGLTTAAPGAKGSNSVFSTLVAEGGGAGVSHGGGNGGNGGSGGGGAISTTTFYSGGSGSQGYSGGAGYVDASWVGTSGGGGGAGAAGAAGGNTAGSGKGGDGLANSISGSSVTYSGGGGSGEVNGAVVGAGGAGGGGSGTIDAAGTSALVNTGGGGGGGSYNAGIYTNGGNGGSGIVIIKYLTPTQGVPIKNPVGKINGSYEFNGVNSGVIIGNSASLENITEGSYSWGAWINAKSNGNAGGGSGSIICKPGSHTLIYLSPSGNLVYNIYNNSNIGFLTVASFSSGINSWHHIFSTLDATTKNISLYLDGVLQNSNTYSGTLMDYGQSSIYIGTCTYGWNFNGSIDEAMIFNRALSATEVSKLYSDGGRKLHLPLDEFSGIVTQDISPSLNSGNLINYSTINTTAPVWNSTGGVNGSGAYTFDGVDDYLLTSINSVPSGAASRTVSAWFNAKSIPVGNYYGSIFSYGTTGCTGGDFNKNFDAVVGNTNKLYFHINGNIASGAAGIVQSSISTNTWYNVVYVYDGLNITAYVNGVLKFSEARSLSTSALGLYLGKASITCAPDYFNGSIDNVQIFNRALNSSEVMALYLQ